MICNSSKVVINNQILKHFKTIQKLVFKQYCDFNLILDLNFYIKYYFKRLNAKADMFIKMSDCIFNNKNEKI